MRLSPRHERLVISIVAALAIALISLLLYNMFRPMFSFQTPFWNALSEFVFTVLVIVLFLSGVASIAGKYTGLGVVFIVTQLYFLPAVILSSVPPVHELIVFLVLNIIFIESTNRLALSSEFTAPARLTPVRMEEIQQYMNRLGYKVAQPAFKLNAGMQIRPQLLNADTLLVTLLSVALCIPFAWLIVMILNVDYFTLITMFLFPVAIILVSVHRLSPKPKR